MPIVKNAIAIIGMMLCSATAYAEGEKVVAVEVQGNHRIEADAVLNAVSLKAGDTFFTEKSDADIRAIYKLGHFQDVRVSLEETEKGRTLVYIVLEKPVVRDVVFEGNKEISLDKLREALELRQNSIFSTKDLAKSITKLKKLYGDEGYYLAEIEPLIDTISPTEKKVTFKITEGKKVLISDIRFDGVHAFSARKLRGVMETKEKWFLSWLTGAGTYKEDVLKNDAQLLSDYYLNNGYVNVKVGEPVVKLNARKDALEVVVGVTEGDQYRIGDISFKGELLESAAELRKKTKSAPGEIFSRAVLRADIGALTDVYADKGYAFANVNPISNVEQDKKKVNLTFDMEKGELVSIERISVAGNAKTRDKVIRREMRVIEGDLFSATGMRRSKQNLMNLGYFEEVNIATARGSAGNKLNVTVDVKEKPTGTFSVGGGYSSLDGFIGQGSVQQSNFLGLGLKANASASIGGKSQTYSIGLTDPHFLDTNWSLGADIYRSERDYNDYSRRLLGGDIKAGYSLSDFVSVFLMYKYEIKDIYKVNPILQVVDPRNYTPGTTSTSSIYSSINRNSTDYRLDPSTGMINQLSAEFAGLGGDNKFARYIVENTLFYPVVKKLVASTRLTLGYAQEINGPVPIDEKFYLGGIGSLRGYKARSVTPLASNPHDVMGSKPIVELGGDTEIFGNAELVFPVIPEAGVKMVVFYDYGNAFLKDKVSLNTMLMSYGGGIRWASPLGPLRLEYGIPLNPRHGIDNKSGRFEFSIGSLF